MPGDTQITLQKTIHKRWHYPLPWLPLPTKLRVKPQKHGVASCLIGQKTANKWNRDFQKEWYFFTYIFFFNTGVL